MADRDHLIQLSKKLTEEGRLIEAGWIGFRLAVMPPSAGAQQLTDMRAAFFAGAQHLFASIMVIMDEDREPTAKDLETMDHIHRELDGFIEKVIAQLHTKGQA